MLVKHDFMWATLVHLGTNMWYEPWDKGHEAFTQLWEIPGSYEMRLDKTIWDRDMEYLKEKGVNTLVIDLGDGIIYDSHPELAIKGSWTKTEMKKEGWYFCCFFTNGDDNPMIESSGTDGNKNDNPTIDSF